MTWLVERLAELRRHLDHLRDLAPRITGREALARDLSLHNDVLFSLLMVSQLVIDVAGELAARRGDRFEDHRAQVIEQGAFAPGLDPSTYAFMKLDLQRNLFRIPLH